MYFLQYVRTRTSLHDLTYFVTMIGGEGKIVEIDESKFGRRKYNRGHHIEGQWVFGGVERGSGESFLVPVERRDEATLFPIIQKYILPGTTIMSDCWRAYSKLERYNYTHLTVNHSQGFKDPVTGACTNQIEGLWRIAKHRIPQYRRQNQSYAGYLAKFMFLSKIQHKGLEPVIEFCKQAGLLYKNTQFSLRDITENRNRNHLEENSDI